MAETPVVPVVLTRAQLVEKYSTLSGAIRALAAEGKSRVEIVKILDPILYQHVRNVLITPLKKTSPK